MIFKKGWIDRLYIKVERSLTESKNSLLYLLLFFPILVIGFGFLLVLLDVYIKKEEVWFRILEFSLGLFALFDVCISVLILRKIPKPFIDMEGYVNSVIKIVKGAKKEVSLLMTGHNIGQRDKEPLHNMFWELLTKRIGENEIYVKMSIPAYDKELAQSIGSCPKKGICEYIKKDNKEEITTSCELKDRLLKNESVLMKFLREFIKKWSDNKKIGYLCRANHELNELILLSESKPMFKLITHQWDPLSTGPPVIITVSERKCHFGPYDYIGGRELDIRGEESDTDINIEALRSLWKHLVPENPENEKKA